MSTTWERPAASWTVAERLGQLRVEADACGVTTSPRTNADSFAVAFVLGFVSHRASTTWGVTRWNASANWIALFPDERRAWLPRRAASSS